MLTHDSRYIVDYICACDIVKTCNASDVKCVVDFVQGLIMTSFKYLTVMFDLLIKTHIMTLSHVKGFYLHIFAGIN